MNKSELLSTYTAEQLAEMVVNADTILNIFRFSDDLKKSVLFENPLDIAYKTELSSKQHEIDLLQSEIEKYRKAFEDAKKERDCQIVEYQKKIEELEKELEYKDGTKMFETLMENTRGEAKECLARHMYENLRCVFRYEKTADEVNITNFLPTEPIKVAEMLINAEGEYEHNSLVKAISGEDKGTYRIFDISELRQIAEHLLVYCNHHREVGE